ncbi:MAG: tRNA (guanosine(37)-N1)-methyltransferase TrmD [Proteobacteria bacterium]|nr:tRNA (guanosine(37)-N1)-methyltransferase TrmD [Pseudomonadota bacterium]
MTAPAPWTAHVLTIHPAMFPGPLAHALAGKALTDGLWAIETIDIRDFSTDKHRTVDDTPFGGGYGMVMKPDVLSHAIEHTTTRVTEKGGARYPVIYLTPRGRPLDQARVHDLAGESGIIIVCGRYEGIDERVLDAHEIEEISVGDFVLSGGEPAAITLIDAVVRLLPGVIGHPEGLVEESFENGLLEYPQYTRPQVWRDRTVPDVLMSGHHDRIRAWRRAESERITKTRRRDLWERYEQTRRARTEP